MLPIVLASLAFWGTALGGAFYFVRRYIRAVERRGTDQIELAELRARIAALEEGLESTRSDVHRLEEGHEFTARLLADRSRSSEK